MQNLRFDGVGVSWKRVIAQILSGDGKCYIAAFHLRFIEGLWLSQPLNPNSMLHRFFPCTSNQVPSLMGHFSKEMWATAW